LAGLTAEELGRTSKKATNMRIPKPSARSEKIRYASTPPTAITSAISGWIAATTPRTAPSARTLAGISGYQRARAPIPGLRSGGWDPLAQPAEQRLATRGGRRVIAAALARFVADDDQARRAHVQADENFAQLDQL